MRNFSLILLFSLLAILFSCGFDKDYTNKDVIENYKSRRKQIRELKSYYNSIVPKDKFVGIEFDGDNHLFRFEIYSISPVTKQLIYPGFLDWNLKTSSGKVKEAMTTIGWNTQTLLTLEQKLDDANCISVESGKPCKIGFQRRDLGKYYYLVLDKPMSDSLRSFYKQYCAYSLYDDSTVFTWGAGAIGTGCYPTN